MPILPQGSKKGSRRSKKATRRRGGKGWSKTASRTEVPRTPRLTRRQERLKREGGDPILSPGIRSSAAFSESETLKHGKPFRPKGAPKLDLRVYVHRHR